LGFRRSPTEAERENIRAKLTGRKLTEERKAAIAAGVRAIMTDERREAVANFHRGRKRPDGTGEAISAALTGRKRNPVSIAKMRASKTGSKASPATRAKMREAQRKAWLKRKAAPTGD
jgi:hypothetical protein